ncbi:ArnT family glycosyltransferase [Chroogloeocystis siderophila]|uniref:Phospholipid carrier-dependent glycosyltransferase n=1 Tax=Chroogloeocystis siderophila 5.2 s.c.1 TaxID=247279 RepID=A0A1U7HFX7_9CHRO|nr:glycosyltransferase family 39 protein [Chroogloeocystis siderophila]OKH22455.1 phospholipid carrier-dependent glycosyltransferase [Chroogloeocystis siderophila 5.2 s.c.1]
MRDRFHWNFSKFDYRRNSKVDWFWILALLLAGGLVYSINLGGLPLRDWDEGTVAQVAREIWRSPVNTWRWLHPTLGGAPYLNKPPLVHLLIAGAYSLGGVNEWTSRLPGAMLSAISVPLLYCVGREIFPRRSPAIFSALVYLTLLPMVRHGRLAMLDGAVVCFLLLMMLCVLRSRRNLRYCLGIGIGFGLICLTKGIIGLLLLAIALLFLFWDTPRLLTSFYLWLGILIGALPVVGWYAAQWFEYGNTFTDTGIMAQSLSRIWASVENHAGPPWYYLLEILKYSFPWLIFLPQGLRKAWENRNWSWAKLILVWSSFYLVAISVMQTKLPWYVLPIYPAISLAVGAQLADYWHSSKASYPRPIILCLGILALVATLGSFYFSPWSPAQDGAIQMILAAVAGTMILANILARRGDRQFLIILIWGMYVALVLFMTSRHWVWELAEAYPVKPVAAMIQNATLPGQIVYTSFPYSRPSLNFYSDRQVIPAATNELQYQWQQNPQSYFLLDTPTLETLQLPSVNLLGSTQGWTLVTRGER